MYRLALSLAHSIAPLKVLKENRVASHAIVSLIIALSFAVAGCSKGASSVDKFVGKDRGGDQEPNYSLDLDPNTYDFGSVLITTVSPLAKTISVKNNSAVNLYISGVSGSGNPDFVVATETCVSATLPLAPGSSCNFVVNFRPVVAGSRSYSVAIAFGTAAGATNLSATASLLGTGATPAQLILSDAPTFDFGAVVATATAEKTLTVTNAGNYAASAILGSGLSAPFAFKGGAYPGTGGTCGTAIAGGANCSLVVTFNPATTGLATGALVLDYNNGDTNVSASRALAGTGSTPAVLSINEGPSYNFGTIAFGSSLEKSFTVSNSGGVSARGLGGSGLAAPFSFKGGAFPGTGGTCSSMLNSSTTCTVIIVYSPTAAGSFNDDIELSYNDGLAVQTLPRSVQGTAVPPALLSINDGPTYNFGTVVVGASSEHMFTVQNSGGVNASVVSGAGLAAPFSYKGGSFPGTGGSCGSTIGAAGTCSIVVVYTPTSAGTFSSSIALSYSNGVSTQASVRAVQGVSVTPATLSISDSPSYDFGIRSTGSTKEKALTVTNTGGLSATSVSGVGLTGAFAFKGGSYPGAGGTCGTTMNAGSSCTVLVTFTPISTGAQSSSLVMTYENGLGTQASVRNLLGTAVGPAAITISESPLYDFGARPIGSLNERAFTLTNSGGFQASSMSGAGLAAPFAFKGGTFPGTGGTCTAELNASASCSVVVTYQPVSAATSNGQFNVSYESGSGVLNSSRSVTGSGVTPALLSISDSPTYDFGAVATGDVAEKSLLVSNTGAFSASAIMASGLSAPFGFKGGTFPGTGGTCSTSLNAGASCTIAVTFAPTTTGTLSSTLQLAYNNGTSAQTTSRGVQGVGAVPATLTLSEGPTLSFGSVPAGAVVSKTITVTNTGGVPASSLTSGGPQTPFLFKGGTYPGTAGTCSNILNAGATCTLVVDFAPAVVGTFTGAVELSYFNRVSAQTSSRAVAGTAVAPASLIISGGPTYNFGTVAVGGRAEANLTISNAGQWQAATVASAALAAPFSYKGGSYPGTGGTCASVLNAGANCSIVVEYQPTATGSQNIIVQITFHDGVSVQTATRAVAGTGAAPASLALNESPLYDFGTLAAGATAEKTLTLSNSGGVTATALSGSGLTTPYSFKGGAFPGTGGTCTSTLSAAGSCTLIVTYAPAVAGASNSSVTITFNDGASGQFTTRAVQGTAVAPAALSLSDGPTYNFGSIPAGGSADKTLTVTNAGQVAATAMVGSGLSAPFSFRGGSYPGTGGSCGASLAPGASCTIALRFAPAVTGTFAATVQLAYQNGVSSVTTIRDLQGIGAAPGSLLISDGATYNFGAWPNGSTREKVFTVSNAGGVDSTAIVGGSLSAPFSYKGGSYPGTGGTCAATLPASAQCTVVVQFSPSAVGPFNGDLQLTYSDGVATQLSSRAFQATSVAPGLLTISDGTTYDFGTVVSGGVAEKTFTVTNSGGFTTSALNGTGLVAPFTFKGGTYPGTGGTCAGTLAPAAACSIVVRFSPTTTGAQSGTVSLTYNDGVGTQTSSRAMQGLGASPATLTLSDGATFNFGSIPAGATADKTFTLTNAGGVTATGLAGTGLTTPFSFKGGTFPGTGGTCGTTLASSATCLITVTYAPSTTGAASTNLDVLYNDGLVVQTASRAITGSAVNPANLSLSDGPTFNFGTLATGASTDKILTLSNTGSFAATSLAGSGLTAPFAFKGGSYPGTGGTCGVSLNAGASCAIVATYAPAVVGTQTANLQVAYFNGATPQMALVGLQGTGAAPATLSISDSPSFDFGTHATGSVTDKTLTVSNSGGVAATALAASGATAQFAFKGGSYPGTGGTCGPALAALATCTLEIIYAPTATGAQSTTLALGYNDGVTTASTSRLLQGSGAAPALLTLSESPTYDFGSVAAGGVSEKTMTVSNSGGVAATSLSGAGVVTPFLFKGGTYPGTGGTCASVLNPGAACSVTILFAPAASGSFSGHVDVNYNNGVGLQTAVRALAGQGVTPAQLLVNEGPTYDFGTLPVGGSKDQILTVTNNGSLAATSIAGGGLNAPFSYKGGSYPGTGGNCGASLNVAATCSIVLNYSPTAVGSHSSSAVLNYFDGATTQNANRAVQGTGAPPAVLSISDGATYNYPSIAAGATIDKTFTITNGGGVTATSLSGGGLTGSYAFKGGTYPGTGGTCSGLLAPTANCTVVVTYAPTAIGSTSTTLTMTYTDGLAGQSASRAIQGTALAPALLVVSNASIYDFGTRATGSSTDVSLSITNSGGVTASSLAGLALTAPFSFKGGSYPGTGGSCATTLSTSATCSVVVTYAPTATGTQSSTVQVSYFDGAATSTATRPVQGTGAAPALLGISDGATYDFGTLASGGTAEKSFTVTNSGGVVASAMSGGGLSAPFGFKGGTYPGTGGTCAATLGASASCTMVLVYRPTAVGPASGSISLTYTDGVGAQAAARALAGTAVAPATLSISDGTTYNFGTLATGATAEHTFTITNGGAVAATSISGAGVVAPFAYKGGSYPGTGGTCGSSLAASASCTILVSYSPTAVGNQTSSIEISFHDGAAVQVSNRGLQGTAAAPAALSWSDGPVVDFLTRATGSVTDRTLTLTNSGGVSATSLIASGLVTPFAFKGGTYPGTGGTCASTLGALANCTVVISYAPTTTGFSTNTLALTYNDGAIGQSAARNVQGTGAAPASLAISDATTYDFGTLASGGTAEKTFTVTNSGGVAATSLSGGGLSAPFSFKGGTFPGTGGTCTASLSGSSSCSFIVVYNPTAVGVASGTVSLAYMDGVTSQSATRGIQGTAVAPALLTVSNGPTYDYGAVVNAGTSDHTFTVTNGGSVAATGVSAGGLSAPFTFKGGTYPGTGGTCAGTVNAAAVCTVVVTFAPTSIGPASGRLDFSYNDGAVARISSRDIQGTGAAAATLAISDGATYDFGSRAVGSTTEKIFTVSNSGGVPAGSLAGANLTAPFSYKGGTFPGTGGTCSASLSPSASCTVAVTYTPSTLAAHSATLTLNYTNGLTPVSTSRPMQGAGVAPGQLLISESPGYDFGTLATGSFSDKSFTVQNTGGFTANGMAGTGLSAPFSYKGGAYPGTGGNCATILTAGGSCTVVVTYAPTATGAQSSLISIAYDDGANSQVTTRTVQGTGAAPALLSLSDGPTYNYGAVANTSANDKSFLLTNSGGVAATSLSGGGLTAPFSFKGGTFPGTGGTCATTLAAGSNCQVVVTFAPTTSGAHASSMTLTYNDGATSASTARAVQGSSTAPATLAVSDGPTYNFGAVANGSATDKSFIVTNSGNFTAVAMAGSGLASPYSFKGGSYPGAGGTCSLTLAPSATCTVVVTFAPIVSGTFPATLSVTYNNGVTTISADRAMTGTSTGPASLSISDGATYDFGLRATGSTTFKTFVVTNGGGYAATALLSSGLSAPFTFRGGTYPGTGGTCGTTLAAGDTCSIVIAYAPTGTGTQNTTLSVAYSDGATSQSTSRAMQGTGAAPALLAVSDGATYNYGSFANGSSNDKSFTISNAGGVSATALSGGGLAAPFSFKGGTFPGTGGTCGSALAASASCSINVTYAPTSSGTVTDDIEISYNDGAANQQTARTVQGSSSAPAVLAISDGATFDFGTVANGSTNEKAFTVTNTGNFSATTLAAGNFAAPFSYKGGTYPGTGGTCSTILAPAATCTILVNYLPTSSATSNATLSLDYNNGLTTVTSTRPMTGVSTPPASLSLSDGPTFDFQTRATGSSTDKTITLTNSGGSPATALVASNLAAPFSFKGGAFPGAGGNCSTSLAAAATCTVVVTYAPTATGLQSNTLTFTFNNGAASGQTATRPLQGTGAAPASLTFSDTPVYDFGSKATGSTTEKSFVVTNAGGVASTSMSAGGLSAPFAFKGGTYPGAGGTCSATLAASATCTVVVSYAPTTVALHTNTMNLSYSNGVTPSSATVDVQGTGVAPALLMVSDGPTYDFGAVVATANRDRTFTVSNTGSLVATSIAGSGLAAPFSFKGGTYPGTGGTCGGSLNAGASCTVILTFNPSATGSFAGSVDFVYNNGASGQTSSRALQGTGASAAVLVVSNSPNYDFGARATGSSNDALLTITNNGGVAGASVSGATLAAPFSYKGGTFPGTGGTCSTSLAAAASCTVAVTYSPSTVAAHSTTLTLNYNDGLAAQSATRLLQGSGVAPATLSLSDGPTYDFLTKATGSMTDRTITVTNGGSFTASSMTGTGLTAPFSFKGGSYPGSGGNCSTTLVAGGSCTIVVTYSPTATGTQSSTTTINYYDGANASSATRPLQGTGAAPALITISDGTTYNFGAVAFGSFNDKSFTITNAGGVVATAMSGGGVATPFSYKGGSYPGTGGTCSTTLASSNTCTIVVTYAPTMAGSDSGSIVMSYNDGVSAQSSNRGVAGSASAPATLTISDGATYSFGAKANGSATDKTFTVSNGGNFPATGLGGSGLSAPYTFKGGSYPGTGGSCGITLTASNSCTLVVTYAPTTTGTFSTQVDLSYNNGVSSVVASRAMTGTSSPPAVLTISDASTYSYGTRATGSSTDHLFVVSNTGGYTASSLATTGLSAPFVYKGGSFPGTGGTCTTMLNASSSCSLVVTYAPTTTGTQMATLTVSYDDGVSVQSVARNMDGTGASPAVLSISDGTTWDFGARAAGSTVDKTFTVSNLGGFPASSMNGGGLSAPFSFKGGSYPGTGGTCSGTLVASTGCTVVVTYAPTAAGNHSGAFTIGYNDGVSAQSTNRGLQGTGVAPANLTISDGPTYDFGPVVATGSADRTFTITNTGALSATSVVASGLSTPFSFKGGTFPGTGGTCGSTLNATANCTVVVSFSPSTTGSFSANLNFAYHDGANNQNSMRAVQGTGATAASLTISDGTTYDYGIRANGSTSDKTFTITNAGGVSASTLNGSGLAASFSFKGGTYPGTGGDCSTTLAPAASCSVVVTYNPTTNVAHNGSLSMTYFNGLSSQTSSRGLAGQGVAAALLTVSDASFNYGTLATGASAEKIFTVSNSGGFTASSMTGTGLAAPFSFKGGSYPGVGGNCSTSLNASQTCSIVVVYAPTTTGTHSTTLNVGYYDGAGAQNAARAMQGTGASPALISISDASPYNFGNVVTGATLDKTFTLTNTGGVTTSAMGGGGLSAPFTFKGGSYPGTGGTCSSTLAASVSCTVIVTYAPTATGFQSTSMSISYNDGVAVQSSARTVQGTGVLPATLTISDGPTYSFGSVATGGGADKLLTVTNSGTVAATSVLGGGLAAPFTYKGGTYPGSGGNCGATIAAGASCSIVIRFAPTVTGSQTSNVSLSYNDGSVSQTASRAVDGVGSTPAVITISESNPYDYGTRANGSTTDKFFTISNTGGVTATTMSGSGLAAPFDYKGGAYPGTGGSCSSSLSSGSSCTVVVTYSPTAIATHSGTLNVTYNDGVSNQTSARTLSGTSVAPATLTISDATIYDFGAKPTGTSTDKTFTVTQGGGVPATGMSGTGLSAPFTFKGGTYPGTGGTCSTSLPVSGSCTIVVTWAPTATGVQSATIGIVYNNGAGSQTASRGVQGNGAAPALLTMSDGATYNFPQIVNGQQSDHSFTVTNAGGVDATSINGGGLTAPFSFKGGSFPGTGGNCSSTLAAGAMCTVVVNFNPVATNSYSQTFSLSYNDGVQNQSANRGVQGSSTSAAVLTISDAAYNFGTIVLGQTADKIFTVTNSGGFSATGMGGSGLSAPFTFKGGTYPGAGGNCGTSLAAGAMCTLVVTFAPTTSSTSNATLALSYNDGTGTQTSNRGMQGTGGTAASITISDGATYNYGAVANGSVTDKVFTVSNSGGAPATAIGVTGLAAPYAFKGGAFPGSGGNCATTLNGSGSCTLVITYSPTTVNTHNGSFNFNYNDGVTSQAVGKNLTGTASAPAVLAFTVTTTYDFGTLPLTAQADATFTITNTGNFTASSLAGAGLAAPFTYKGGSYPGTGGSCTTSLAVSASCTVVVTYAPTATGAQSSTTSINYYDGATNQSSTRAVQGTGATAALLAIDGGTTYDYGTLPTGGSADKTFTITNSGGVSATAITGASLAAPYSFKGGSFPGTGGNCSSTLASSQSCSIVVTFAPTATGTQNATISVGYNTGVSTTSATRPVTGLGANPAALSISDAGYDYGTVITGQTLDKVFTISNTGGVTASGMAGSGISAPFTFKSGSYPGSGGTCGATLGAGANCTMVVTFAPLTTGIQSATINVAFNTGVSASNTTRAIQGTGGAPAAPTSLSRIAPVTSPNNVTSVQLRVGGIVNGDVIKIYTDSGCVGGMLISGTASSTTLDLTPSLSTDNIYNFYATRTNAAGTTSACSTATATYTLDTTPPVITGMVNQVPARSPHWSATPTFRVSGTFAGDTVNIYSNSTCTSPVVATSPTGTGSFVDVTLPTISSQGAYNYYFRAVDSVGNSSACHTTSGFTVAYVYDATDVTVGFATYYDVTTEASGTLNVQLTLSAVRPYPVTVIYRTVGTAAAGTHFSGLTNPGTVTVPAGATTVNLPISIIDNNNVEPDKYVDIALTDTTYEYAHAAGQIYHRVLIKDNDQAAAVPVSLPTGYSAGNYSSCFIGNDKKLRCLGRGLYGQPGDGTLIDKFNYVAIDTGNNYAKVSVGVNHNCALTASGGSDPAGTIKCWGFNGSGGLGDGSQTNRIQPQTVTSMGTGNLDVSAGSNFTCGLKANGSIWCWGTGNSRQVLPTSTTTNNLNPVQTDANAYTSISLGSTHACAIRSGGAVYCWGSGANGRVGDGTSSTPTTGVVLVDSGVNYQQIVSGEGYSCGLTTAGKIKCWGQNNYGQLGTNNTTDQAAPVAVDTSVTYTKISAGSFQTCGITSTNTLRCTGRGDYGQLMDRLASDNTTTFADIQSGTNFNNVSCGYNQSWATTTAGIVISGGWDQYYASSGDGQNLASTFAPTAFDVDNTYNKLDKGFGERSTCALKNGKVRCVGFGDTTGFWGIGQAPDMAGYMWLDVANDYATISSSRFHMCGIRTTGGKLYCAGNGAYNGTGTSYNTLRAVDPTTSYSEVVTGGVHSCAITTGNALKCWGNNANARLGDGTTTSRNTPVVIDSGVAYAKVSPGNAHTCGITTSSQLKCWGAQNNGRVGDGVATSTNAATPVVIDSGVSYAEVSAGGSSTCAIVGTLGSNAAGLLKCWGNNANGQLGNNSTTQTASPVEIDNTNTYLKVAVGDTNTCAIRSDGKMYCWGNWQWGIIGSLGVNQLTPSAVDTSFTYTDVAMGKFRMCGLTTTGQIRCMGNAWFNTWGDYTRPWIPEALPAPGFIQN